MRRRAGRYARDKALHDRRAWLLSNWIVVVKASLIWALVSAITLGYLHLVAPTQLFWFGAGGLFVAFGWLMSSALDAADGTALRRLGGDAERWVSDELRRLRKDGWVVIDHVPFADGDVDHLVVGPGGAWAIETKRSSTPVRVSTEAISGLYGGDPCYQARRGARHVRHLLRQVGVEVRPAVVLAGPGSPDLPASGAVVTGDHGDVLVLTLRNLHAQLRSLEYTQLTPEQISAARRITEDFVGRRDQHEKENARR